MSKSIRILILFIGVFSGPPMIAQIEGTLYSMNSLPQVVNSNPAFVPKYKFTLGLPGISSMAFTYANNGFAYNDLIKKENGVTKADVSKLSSVLADKNYITSSAQVDLFRLGLKISKLYVTLSATGKTYSRLLLPKDFTSLLIEGNSQFIGKTANFSIEGEGLAYLEAAVGASYQINDKLTIGGRYKFLKGIANATTELSNTSVSVADNYQITASAEAMLKTSGIYGATQSGFDVSNSVSNYLNNNGAAFDIGATFKVTKKLSVAASIIDIGKISWKNDLYQYSLDKSKATYTLEGIDVQDLIDGNTDLFPGISDTLQNRFKLKESITGSYSTALPSKVYLSGNYELIKNLSFAAVFYSETFRNRVSAGWTGSVNKHFGRIASLSVSYTVAERSANNLGAGLSLNLAPFQFYLVGDNLLNAPISLATSQNLNSYINATQYFNVRTGINFVFGRDREVVAKPTTFQSGPRGKSGKQLKDKGKKRKPGEIVKPSRRK
jgi:hypothetical protein